MRSVAQFYEDIALDRDAINDAAYNGDDRAIQVIKIHRMHVARPHDQAALGLCMAAYNDWKRNYMSGGSPKTGDGK